MAQKNNSSRAEKMVSEARKKSGVSQSSSTGKKNQSSSKNSRSVVKTEYDSGMSSHAVVSLVSLSLFLLFFVISVKPEGALTQVFQSVVLGLIGQGGFYFSMPVLFYLFVINTFGKKRFVTMKNVCGVSFAFVCGCIYHLAVQTQGMATGKAIISDLYLGGAFGSTGGVLCGGAALLLRWACGNFLAMMLCILIAVFTLLGAIGITPPSIYRAIANRPRYEEDEDDDDYVEPATVVVNHIANKQIEHKRQRRQAQLAAQQMQAVQAAQPVGQLPQSAADKAERNKPSQRPAQKVQEAPKQPVAVQEPVQNAQEPVQQPVPEAEEVFDEDTFGMGTPARASHIMNTIGMDSTTPIGAARKRVSEPIPDAIPAKPVRKGIVVEPDAEEPVSRGMPKLERNAQPVKPKQEPAPVRRVPVAPKAPVKPVPENDPEEAKPGKVSAKEAAQSARQVAAEIAQNQTTETSAYSFPPISLLKKPMRGGADGTEEMRENSRRLNETLASFKIDAHIINVTRGPSVTRYEVELDKGVRLNKLTGCADDIALSLGASGVRIAAVPGKISVVGIEVPNRAVTMVSLREVIDSPEFARAKSKSSFSVGKDIGGNCIVGNIAKMPHMLIAGTTGSGKSVCMNSIIISLLYKASPEDVKLIMVDPKMVELGIYNGIPHLLIPVVTDPKKAAGSLQWAVTEMLRRYKLMSDAGVRDLESYNSIMASEEDGQKLPQVVIIIDELADLMMVAAKEVEDSICRIAQMGRASGMHLIIATQRPSADVITGLMKANIPSRIAFSVASAMESRIILDTMGAEKLVGKGDMLYAPIGCGKPLRVQGCFVTDGEVEAVASFVKDNYSANYNQQVLDEIEKKAAAAGKKTTAASVSDPEPNEDELDGDEMLPAAVDVILETGQASVSMLQRRLKLGYARAARIVDEMEEKGIVGPFQGSKPRSILITKEQWASMKNGQPQQMDFDDLEEFDAVPDELM